jgi:hypothetical protein
MLAIRENKGLIEEIDCVVSNYVFDHDGDLINFSEIVDKMLVESVWSYINASDIGEEEWEELRELAYERFLLAEKVYSYVYGT